MFTITWFDLHKTFHKLCTKYSFEISYFIIPSRLFKVLWYTFLPTSFTALFFYCPDANRIHMILIVNQYGSYPQNLQDRLMISTFSNADKEVFFNVYTFVTLQDFMPWPQKSQPSLFRGLQRSPSNKEGTLNVSTCNYHQIKV